MFFCKQAEFKDSIEIFSIVIVDIDVVLCDNRFVAIRMKEENSPNNNVVLLYNNYISVCCMCVCIEVY